MRGEAIRCDNCGDFEFIPVNPTLRYGRLAFLFKDDDADDGDEPEADNTPSKWLSVAKEFYNSTIESVDADVKHFCSPVCLEFAVRYIYDNKEVPTTPEGDK